MSDTFAVIATGGKQTLVHTGETIRVESLPGDPGMPVTFTEVIVVTRDAETRIGQPTVAAATVQGIIVRHGRHKKVTGVKFKAKKRYRKKFGHRQHFTEVRIKEIVTG